MDIIKQTKVTENNREDFYRVLYNLQTWPRDRLIDVSSYCCPIVVIDSCGWYYRQCFENNKFILVEGVQTCKSFNLNKGYFDYLFDDRKEIPTVPTIKTADSVLLIDHSPSIFRYKDPKTICTIISQACDAARSLIARVRIPLMLIDDHHLQDRIHDLIKIVPKDYITTFVHYDLVFLNLEFRKKKYYAISIN